MRKRACVLVPGNVPFKFRLFLFLSTQTSVLSVIFFICLFVCFSLKRKKILFEMELVKDKDLSFFLFNESGQVEVLRILRKVIQNR